MPVNCKLCSSSNTKRLFTSENIHGRRTLSREEFSVCECLDCKITFTDVCVDGDFYDQYYPCDYYESSRNIKMREHLLGLMEKLSFRRKLKLILKHKPEGNKILEIGCGQGQFLKSLPSTFQKFGVEIHDKGYHYVQKNYPEINITGEDIRSESFSSLEASYDIIVMWHVLEHIKDPESFCQKLSTLLGENGVFIFEVPNRNSLGFRWTQKKWFHLDTPRHLFHYDLQSVRSLLGSHGLKIINYSGNTIDYWHDLSISICKRFLTKNPLSNIIVWACGLPMSFFARLFSSLFLTEVAEVNTYIVKHSS